MALAGALAVSLGALACGAPEPSASAVVSETPLLSGVRFVEVVRPEKAYPMIVDLAVFRGRLYLATAVNPIGAFGARVLSTDDGERFRVDLDRPFSQGFLRLRVLRDTLYVPDAAPPDIAPGRLYASADGERFDEIELADVVHTFDVIEYDGVLLTSNAMRDARGALLREPDAPGAPWARVAATDVQRLKFMVEHQGALLVAKLRTGSPADYFRLAGSPRRDAVLRPVDAVPGEAITFRWYVSGRGRLFWSMRDDVEFRLLWSDGGDRWREVAELRGQQVAALAELDGNLYALTSNGLYGSRDHERFELVAAAPAPGLFGPVLLAERVGHADASASLVALRGRLWAGAVRGGRLFRIE